MQQILLAAEAAKKFLEQQLIEARKAGLSVKDALYDITEALEEFGMERGFLPVEPLKIRDGLQGLSAVIAFCDYETEQTIAV